MRIFKIKIISRICLTFRVERSKSTAIQHIAKQSIAIQPQPFYRDLVLLNWISATFRRRAVAWNRPEYVKGYLPCKKPSSATNTPKKGETFFISLRHFIISPHVFREVWMRREGMLSQFHFCLLKLLLWYTHRLVLYYFITKDLL